MPAPSSDYYATLLQTLHQITTYLITTLNLLPTKPGTIPQFARPSVHDSLSHRLTCAEKIYKIRLAEVFSDEAILKDATAKLMNGPMVGGTDEEWGIVSDGEWEAEVEDLRTLGETWVLLLQELKQRIEGHQKHQNSIVSGGLNC